MIKSEARGDETAGHLDQAADHAGELCDGAGAVVFADPDRRAAGAWVASFDGRIKLLKPITAQGSLEGKIILSQYVGLFQTMETIQSSVIRFPFIVDSPRGKEASDVSSQEILSMIASIRSLPQVILATVDYEKFNVDVEGKVIKLDRQRKLLDEETYAERQEEIENLYGLLNGEIK